MENQKNVEKIYMFLITLYSVILVTANLIFHKYLVLPIGNIYEFNIPAGTLIYPFIFLLTDIITEFYGKEKARLCSMLGICMNAVITIIIIIISKMQATEWSRVTDDDFHNVFGLSGIIFISSMVANFISQTVDITIYLWLRKLTGDKFLWLRTSLSSSVALCIDAFIIIGVLVISKAVPEEQFSTLFINTCSFKVFYTICSIPVFYGAVYLIRFLIKKDPIAI
jgi:uncharacterized integral membrane protein (TIGR00697 family)